MLAEIFWIKLKPD